jgi:hypothetical protein
MKNFWVLPALLATALFSGIGCNRKQVMDLPAPVGIASVEIVISADTLEFRPGMPMCVTGFAVVKDEQQNSVADIPVSLTLPSNSLGHIELADSAGGNRTNSNGRLNFLYCANGIAGRDTICANCHTIMDCVPLVLDTARGLTDSSSVYHSSLVVHR